MVGGHSASFVAHELLEHAAGSIDCVMRGEAEAGFAQLLDAFREGPAAIAGVPGAVTLTGYGPPPRFAESLDTILPARDLLRHRRKYFIGILDPCASMEFSRGCPWDCAFCSAWTFYGRSYRTRSTESIVDELQRIREPGIFLVDDVAFIHPERGMEIGEAIRRRGIAKQWYLETRGDVLLRNREVFRFWKGLGLQYMFLGIEAIEEDSLQQFRKRTSTSQNMAALAAARELGIEVAINVIVDPNWSAERFKVLREWCLERPEIVNLTVNTPYPGTETWLTEARKLTSLDYRLFDITHAVLPTHLPLRQFYDQLVETYQVLNRKHINKKQFGWRGAYRLARLIAARLWRGQTNFVRMLFRFNSVINTERLLADHAAAPSYSMRPPDPARSTAKADSLFIHPPAPRLRKHEARAPATSEA
jgi:magnesium-protoporphyrin IX monomethyl ester (oxidative) cyclase